MKHLIESEVSELVIRLTDPAYTPNKSAISFSLSLAKPEGPELISIPGWRVWKGSVVPPSTRKKNGSFFRTVELDPKVEGILNRMVQEWAKAFPMVRFPSVDAGGASSGEIIESSDNE